MIEIGDLKRVKLEEDDLLVFQVDHKLFFTPNASVKHFFKHLRKYFKNKIIMIPSSIKLGIIKDFDVDKLPDIEVKPILFDPNNLSMD